MKRVYVSLKEVKYSIPFDAIDVEFMNVGKGILHIITNEKEYYYPLEVVRCCSVRNDD